jgi:diacylglycerol kinase
MKKFFRSRRSAFGYAFSGWGHVLRTQRNAWVHALFTLVTLVLGFWLRISYSDWAAILLAITLVWMSEFLNTALEAVVDLASPTQHRLAKIGKDVGAAAVLIAAGASVLIGLLILGPPLWARIQPLFISSP